jgi:hypothetical protein
MGLIISSMPSSTFWALIFDDHEIGFCSDENIVNEMFEWNWDICSFSLSDEDIEKK